MTPTKNIHIAAVLFQSIHNGLKKKKKNLFDVRDLAADETINQQEKKKKKKNKEKK
jgi:hypothetical protein